MLELFREAVSSVNLPFTILLGLLSLYWLMVAAGLLDFDADGGVHHDLHVGPGGGSEGALEGIQGAMKSGLQFLNIGSVPAMIVGSIMALSLWFWSMLGNHYFNDGSWARAAVLLVPNLILTVLLTRVLTTPLKKMFNALNREYEEHKPVVGRTCVIVTSEVTDSFGQAQIDTTGAPLLINVRTYGETVLTKGETALIIKEDKENNLFTVAKLSTATPQQESTLC